MDKNFFYKPPWLKKYFTFYTLIIDVSQMQIMLMLIFM